MNIFVDLEVRVLVWLLRISRFIKSCSCFLWHCFRVTDVCLCKTDTSNSCWLVVAFY